MRKKEIYIHLLSIVLSITTMYYGLNSDLFEIGKTTEEHAITKILGPFSVSLLILIIGERIAISFYDPKIDDIIKKIKAGAPILESIIEFPSADEAMEYLAGRLLKTKIVLNTKISNDSIHPSSTTASHYISSLKKGLKSGLVYKDVVSSGFENYAKEIKEYATSNASKGKYDYVIGNINSPCFLNFTILHLHNEPPELLIGWATSKYFGGEQKAYKIVDKRVIEYFEKYHMALFTGS